MVVLRDGHEPGDGAGDRAPGAREGRDRAVQVPAHRGLRDRRCRRRRAARSSAPSCAISRADRATRGSGAAAGRSPASARATRARGCPRRAAASARGRARPGWTRRGIGLPAATVRAISSPCLWSSRIRSTTCSIVGRSPSSARSKPSCTRSRPISRVSSSSETRCVCCAIRMVARGWPPPSSTIRASAASATVQPSAAKRAAQAGAPLLGVDRAERVEAAEAAEGPPARGEQVAHHVLDAAREQVRAPTWCAGRRRACGW